MKAFETLKSFGFFVPLPCSVSPLQVIATNQRPGEPTNGRAVEINEGDINDQKLIYQQILMELINVSSSRNYEKRK